MPSQRRTAALMKVSILVTLVVIAVYVAVILYQRTERNHQTLLMIATVPLVVLIAWTLIAVRRIPRRTVSKLPKTEDRHERVVMRRLSPRRWERAVVDARLAVEDRSHLDRTIIQTPCITSVRAVPLGVALTVEAIPGQAPEDIKKRIPHLGSALAVPLVFRAIGARTVECTARLRDPLSAVMPVQTFPELDPHHMAMTFGVCEDGEPARWAFGGKGGGIVGGEPGAGKTAWATLAVGPLLLSPYAEVHIIDGKGGLDWSWAEGLADSYTNESRHLDAVAQQIEAFDEAMEERLRAVPEGESSNFWHRRPSGGERFSLLILDECQTYLNASGKPTDVKKIIARITAAVENVVKKGRSAGFFVLLMTQKPTADAIPTAIRDNCGPRLAFRVNTRAAEEAILGELPDNVDDPARAAHIPDSRAGGAVMADDAGRRVYVRAAYLPEARATQIVKEAA